MSDTTVRRWLVTYDICDAKRLGRLFRKLKKEGIPIQYSVFYVCKTLMKMNILMSEISKLIDLRVDDVRAYQLPSRGFEVQIGRSILPSDIYYESAITDVGKKAVLRSLDTQTDSTLVNRPSNSLIIFD